MMLFNQLSNLFLALFQLFMKILYQFIFFWQSYGLFSILQSQVLNKKGHIVILNLTIIASRKQIFINLSILSLKIFWILKIKAKLLIKISNLSIQFFLSFVALFARIRVCLWGAEACLFRHFLIS